MAGPFFIGQRFDAKWRVVAAVDLALNVTAKLKEQQKTRRPGQRQEVRRHNGCDEAPDFSTWTELVTG